MTKTGTLFLAAAALCAGLTLASCGEGSTSRSAPLTGLPSALPSPASLLVPTSGSIYLGVFVNPSQEPSPPPTLLSNFEQAAGRRMALSTHYYGFFAPFPGPNEISDEANGRIPVESCDCQLPNAEVAAGKVDSTIRARADALKAFGYPVFVRYMWEMNLPSSPAFRQICYDPATDLPNGQFSPEEFIAAWDRIRAIFAQEGATNVVWVWNPSGGTNPLAYYPGPSETDWVGFDRYDIGNLSMVSTFKQPYAWLSVLNKPIMVGETGATLQEQPQYFANASATLQSDFPDIKAFVYFDSANPNYAGPFNWAITSTTFSAFVAMANQPYFSATQL